MRREGGSGGLDRFRVLAALLVAANHTSPLLDLSPLADHILTQILARLAVPFFLAVSGCFLLPRAEEQGRRSLLPFCRRVLLLYAGATLLYLPLRLYSGALPGPLGLLRDVVFDGTFYHLWYFPALLLGLVLTALAPRRALWYCVPLYLLGLLGDSYFALTAALPPLRACYDLLFRCFDQTRNGLFLSPLFLALGERLGRTPPRRGSRFYAAAMAGALALLLGEGLLVSFGGLARYSTMYLSLPLALWLLFRLLQTLDLPRRPELGTFALVFYLIHPWAIVAVRGGARLTGTVSFFVEQSLTHFLAVVLLSGLLSALACRALSRRNGQPAAPAAPSRVRCWVEVDGAALQHNLAVLRRRLPEGGKLMAVVKADAYGHGALPVARLCAAEGVDAFAVATVAEGAALRRGGITGDILVLGRSFPPEFSDAFRHDLILTAADALHARELAAFGRPLRVHAAVDTGMARLGFPAGDLEGLAALFRDPRLRVEGLFTHLCAADGPSEADAAFTRAQLQAFFTRARELRALGIDPGALHVQASAGLLRYPGLPCTYARPGLALYGVGDGALRPVLTLKCRVAAVRDLSPGETAGYGRAFQAERPTRLAVLTAGYADGLPRSLGGRGRVLLHGQSAPLVGRICMDQALADVTGIPDVCPGDEATLLGPGLPAEEVARAAGTIPNELLSRLGSRVERVYL